MDKLISIVNANPIILIYNNNVSKKFPNKNYQTWSYVKGETIHGNVLVVLTEKTNKIVEKRNLDAVSNKTKNMLYVALTRSESDVFIVQNDLWKEVK